MWSKWGSSCGVKAPDPHSRIEEQLEKSGEAAVLHHLQENGWLKGVNDPGHRCHVPVEAILSGKMSRTFSLNLRSATASKRSYDAAPQENKYIRHGPRQHHLQLSSPVKIALKLPPRLLRCDFTSHHSWLLCQLQLQLQAQHGKLSSNGPKDLMESQPQITPHQGLQSRAIRSNLPGLCRAPLHETRSVMCRVIITASLMIPNTFLMLFMTVTMVAMLYSEKV